MPFAPAAFRTAIACLSMLMAGCLHAEDIDTEHLFGFMIGSDTGKAGEREFQTQTTGRFSRAGGTYRALNQELELEFVPVNNFRIEVGSSFASHNIIGVPGFEDRRQLGWQGVSLDLRYRLLNRDTDPFGLTFAVENHFSRVDEASALAVRNYGTEFTLALDREVVPNLAVAAVNLIYQPDWTRFVGTRASEQEATVGAAFALMGRLAPGVIVGGEARYLRRYDSIGLDEFAGQALFVGPTAYFQLSERSRLTIAWSVQAWGRPAFSSSSLDLVNFDRQQARVIFGVNF